MRDNGANFQMQGEAGKDLNNDTLCRTLRISKCTVPCRFIHDSILRSIIWIQKSKTVDLRTVPRTSVS